MLVYVRGKPDDHSVNMRNPLKRGSSNPWLEQDRRHQRRIIVTAVVLAVAVLGGLGWLVHALMDR